MKHTLSLRCKLCNGPMGTRSNRGKKTRGFSFCFSCVSKNPTDEHRCCGKTSVGLRCNRWRYSDSEFCSIHEKRGVKWQE